MKLTFAEHFRALVQDPFDAVRRAGVSEGQKVADLGAGFGYFTIPAAVTVGASGLVYAVEPDAARSDRIRRRVAAERLQNVQVLTTGVERLGEIPTASVDLAFSAFSLHHFSDKQAGFAEILRVLKEGGTFYVWDRVPGMLVKHGTRKEELGEVSAGFSKLDILDAGRTLRARYTK